ncbi:hypothetical protein D3C72_1954810 [compost metagenome]
MGGCSLQPQRHGRRHQRHHVDLVFFDEIEAGKRLRIGGHDHGAAGVENAERAGRAHRVIMRHRNGAKETGLRREFANLRAGPGAVIIVVVRPRDQFRGSGAAAGKLEQRHLV